MLFDERIVLMAVALMVGDVLCAFAFRFFALRCSSFFRCLAFPPFPYVFPVLPPFLSHAPFFHLAFFLPLISTSSPHMTRGLLSTSTTLYDLLDIGGGRSNGGEEVHNIASYYYFVCVAWPEKKTSHQ